MQITDIRVSFLCPCVLQITSGGWVTAQDFIFTISENEAVKTITIPKGFVTDLASVPRFPLMFTLFGDRARQSAVIHDWLYDRSGGKYADAVFYAAMRNEEPGWRRAIMWLGVRAYRLFRPLKQELES